MLFSEREIVGIAGSVFETISDPYLAEDNTRPNLKVARCRRMLWLGTGTDHRW